MAEIISLLYQYSQGNRPPVFLNPLLRDSSLADLRNVRSEYYSGCDTDRFLPLLDGSVRPARTTSSIFADLTLGPV